MDFVIFKNPSMHFREEEFGGVAKLESKFFILSKKQYNFLKPLEKFTTYNSLDEEFKDISLKLMDNNLLIKLDLNKAKKLGFNP